MSAPNTYAYMHAYVRSWHARPSSACAFHQQHVHVQHVCMPMSAVGMHGTLTWNAQAEDGEIISGGNSFFLPQRVYMPQGSLADCLSYPQRQGGQADLGTFVDALRRVGLQKLEREKMDIAHDWPRMLSPGSRAGLLAFWPGWMRPVAAAVAAAAVGGLACERVVWRKYGMCRHTFFFRVS